MREGLLQSKAFKACFSYTLFSGVSWRGGDEEFGDDDPIPADYGLND